MPEKSEFEWKLNIEDYPIITLEMVQILADKGGLFTVVRKDGTPWVWCHQTLLYALDKPNLEKELIGCGLVCFGAMAGHFLEKYHGAKNQQN